MTFQTLSRRATEEMAKLQGDAVCFLCVVVAVVDRSFVFCLVHLVTKATHHPNDTFFIRNYLVSNLVLDSLTFKKLLELQGES